MMNEEVLGKDLGVKRLFCLFGWFGLIFFKILFWRGCCKGGYQGTGKLVKLGYMM